jgi:HlyD family secretion protein
MRIDRKSALIVGSLVVVAVAAFWALRGRNHIEYLSVKIDRGSIYDVVEATGTVHAVVLVQVGSQVSGSITKLYADFNSQVHRGDVVALIDPALFKGALDQAVADLDTARANVAASKENVVKAEANVLQAKADFERAEALNEKHYVAAQTFDQSRAAYDGAKASLGASRAAVVQADAQVRQKQAAVAVAKTNLEYTIIRSPIDGTIVARNVNMGQTVAASLQAPTIFDIAQDLKKMQLYAKTDESEVGRIAIGKTVTFKVDAFPHEIFHGVVSQLRMNPTTVQNVVTYDTIVDFDNPDLKIFPGMTAYVTIPVASAENALRAPNTALRFEPPLPATETLRLYQQYGIGPDEPGSAGGTVGSASDKPKLDTAIVWKLGLTNAIEPVQVRLGITDHAYTEVASVRKGTLSAGDAVVTAAIASKSAAGPGTP